MTKVEQKITEEERRTIEPDKSETFTLGEAADISSMTRIRAMVEEEEGRQSQEKSTVKSRV